MYKYILPLLVLTGCIPLKNASLEESDKFFKDHIEWRVINTVKKHFDDKNKTAEYKVTECNNTSKCLKKPTYLVYDYYLDQYQCLLVETNKIVSCK